MGPITVDEYSIDETEISWGKLEYFLACKIVAFTSIYVLALCHSGFFKGLFAWLDDAFSQALPLLIIALMFVAAFSKSMTR